MVSFIRLHFLIFLMPGVVLTVTASIQLFASVGSAVLFNEIYHPETKVNGHHYNPGIIFWISAGCWAVIIPLIM